MRTFILFLSLFLWQTAGADTDDAEDSDYGRLCLASIATPNDSPKSLSNPSGENPDTKYSVSVAGRSAVDLLNDSGVWVERLSTSVRHAIVIIENGERSASFFLKFDESESSQCLFLAPLYQTWQLWPSSRTGKWCDCPDSE